MEKEIMQNYKEAVKSRPAKKYQAQEEYHKRIGLISKSYKLNSKLVNDFAEACAKADVKQAQQLSIMMQNFIDQIKGGAE